MNTLKFQKEVLTALAKEKKVSVDYRMTEDYENFICCTLDGFIALIIHKNDWFIDNSKVSELKLDTVIKEFNGDYKQATLTNEIDRLKDGRILNKLKTDDGIITFFDEKMLRYFDKNDLINIKFFIKDRLNPIYVKIGDTIQAIIMPVRNEEKYYA